MKLTLQQIREAVVEAAGENGAVYALLFGSYARGTATRRSDVDVIFVEETDLPFLKRLDRYLNSLVDRLHTPVEVLVYTPQEFERMKEKRFVKQALQEGIILYER